MRFPCTTDQGRGVRDRGDARRDRRAAAALAIAAATLAACGPPPTPAVPVEASRTGPATDLERHVFLLAQDRCLADEGPPCAWSSELEAAARALAAALVLRGPGAFDSESFVRGELARAGVGHPDTMAAALFYSGGVPSERDLGAFVSGVQWRFPAREFAVAQSDPPAAGAGPGAAPGGRSGALVVVGMRRLVDIDAPPRWLPQEATVTFGGGLLPGWTAPHAFLSGPSGSVGEVAVRTGGDGGFQGALPIGPEPGRYMFELMAEHGGEGPSVVYLMPIELSPTPPNAGAGPPASQGSTTTDPAAAVRVVQSLVAAFRAERGLPSLDPSADLERVAAAHAEDMAGSGFFGHVSPTRGDLSQRLRTAGIRAPRAAENLALGPSAEEAFASLLDSPAHRANFLDPALTLVGVACARSGGSLVFAIVMGAE